MPSRLYVRDALDDYCLVCKHSEDAHKRYGRRSADVAHTSACMVCSECKVFVSATTGVDVP